jgi:hypothetical protein
MSVTAMTPSGTKFSGPVKAVPLGGETLVGGPPVSSGGVIVVGAPVGGDVWVVGGDVGGVVVVVGGDVVVVVGGDVVVCVW